MNEKPARKSIWYLIFLSRFLCTNNAMGNIVYEHRELIGNEKLRDKYYHMKLMGSMYMTKEAAEKRLFPNFTR